MCAELGDLLPQAMNEQTTEAIESRQGACGQFRVDIYGPNYATQKVPSTGDRPISASNVELSSVRRKSTDQVFVSNVHQCNQRDIHIYTGFLFIVLE